jgi:serine/threonine protein kinase
MGATAHPCIWPLLWHRSSKLILQDIEKLLNNLPAAPIPAGARRFLAVTKFLKYPPSLDDYFTFEVLAFFPERQPSRLLYVAKTPGVNKQAILIKFARWYSIELHDFCAKSGHAPPILAFERLPGGWYAVAMEYIESGITITHSNLLPAHRDRWTEELQRLIDNFHAEGLVHGDLRAANIICREDSMMLIDFDWGGKAGEVFYPTASLNDELQEGRVSNDLRR